MTDMDKLIEAIEVGAGVSTRFTRSNAIHRPASSKEVTLIDEAYYGSLDAAMALQDALLPGWVYGLNFDAHRGAYAFVGDGSVFETDEIYNKSHARAWLLAILKAYRATQEASQ